MDSPELDNSPLQPAPAPAPAESPEDIAVTFDLRKAIINLFLVWQVLAVAVWLLPDGIGRQTVYPVVSDYMRFTGCWQQWTMFSPSPYKNDSYVEARIEYPDGTSSHWNVVRMHDLGYVQKYQRERFRKAIENMHLDDNSRMWPYLSRYCALQSERSGRPNYPMTVHLVRHFRYISPPSARTLPFAAHEFYHFTYDTRPESI